MNLLVPHASTTPTWQTHLPGWTVRRGREANEADAAFAAGIALNGLLRANPAWLGCWRDRLALKSAIVAAKMVGRNEEETNLRDAVLLTVDSDDLPDGIPIKNRTRFRE